MSGSEVSLTGVTKTFAVPGGQTAVALRDLSLQFSSGEFTVIVGPNGSGKSTLLRLLGREILPDSGEVRVAIAQTERATKGSATAWVHQDPVAGTVGELSVEDNLRLAAIAGRVPRPWRIRPAPEQSRYFARIVGPRLSVPFNRLAAELSHGQRQMLAMEMALLQQPSLLLLDEHTASLDEANAVNCLRLTKEAWWAARMTVIMVTHNFTHASSYGGRLVVLRDGAVAADVCGDEKSALSPIDIFRMCGLDRASGAAPEASR
jgi:putative ABC transport system ATP-binding protein